MFEGFSPSRSRSPSAPLLTLQGAFAGTRSPGTRKGKEKALNTDLVEGVEGEMVTTSDDARKGLRELVRRSTMGGQRPLLRGDESRAVSIEDRAYTPRRYYILTNAGKPVFSSHSDTEEDISNLMAVAQALISIFAEDDDRLRSIRRGDKRIVFLLKAPLYMVCVSDWGEPENVLRVQLDYIYLQVLSVATSTQLARAFQRRSNFDPTRLLEGTDQFLHNLIARSQHDFSYLTSTLQPLRMAPALREAAAAALMPPSRIQDLLYVLLVAGGRIVTLLRPRKHAVHPSDLHLLLNMLDTSKTLRSSEAWVPICLPKFNPAGFVHAYVDFPLPDVGLLFVSADREAFDVLRAWKKVVVEKLQMDDTLGKIRDSIPYHEYSISALGCPGLRHFIYKSRQLVQITMPEWEESYEPDGPDRKRIITTYQCLHDAVHARSGQSTPLKLVYTRSDQEACLAWFTKPFEMYLTVPPHLPKSVVVSVANAVFKWVQAEEGKLFLKDAPVF
ncbi:vacuolar fusion protein MON1 [Tremella mesenterica]|uniref:Vacuolar fusion protein MON1 n=1 Tax=Tremella mesenterica TaxID=5217 RepID=A0A4Q1BIE8_TREME|nr:vacuolar fusion protein MON1 [Tremella mesenterica]